MAMRRLYLVAVLLAAVPAFCTSADPCSLTSTVNDAKVILSIPADRTSFREGEIIPLMLSFTPTAVNATGQTTAAMTATDDSTSRPTAWNQRHAIR